MILGLKGLRNLGGDVSSRPSVAQCPAPSRGRGDLKLKMFENQITLSDNGTTIKKSVLFFLRISKLCLLNTPQAKF